MRLAVAGLILALGSLAAPSPARAGLVVGSTTIIPVNDPSFGFDFRLKLGAGDQIVYGDHVTIHGVADIPNPILSNVPFGWYTSAMAIGGGKSDITFTYILGAIIDNSMGTGYLSLGDFIVSTTVDYKPPPPPELLVPLKWDSVASTPGHPHSVRDSGTVQPFVATPEPGTLALMGMGAGGLLLWRVRGRGRRD